MDRSNEARKAARKALNESFEERMKPRLVWNSQSEGTAIRTARGYRHKPAVAKVKVQLTEAQDNAIGRAHRRRQNKALRGWLPYAKR